MKRKSAVVLMSLLGAAFWAQPSSAIVIDDSNAGANDGTDVGSVDSLLGEAYLNGNPVDETNWVNSVLSLLGEDPVTYQIKDEPVSYYNKDTADVFAFLMDAPGSGYLRSRTAIMSRCTKTWTTSCGAYSMSVN